MIFARIQNAKILASPNVCYHTLHTFSRSSSVQSWTGTSTLARVFDHLNTDHHTSSSSRLNYKRQTSFAMSLTHLTSIIIYFKQIVNQGLPYRLKSTGLRHLLKVQGSPEFEQRRLHFVQ